MSAIVFEIGSFVWAIAGFRSQQAWEKKILPEYCLVFDTIHFFGDTQIDKFFNQAPFASFSNEMSEQLYSFFPNYQIPSGNELKDLRKALGDKEDSDGGGYAYYGTRATLDYCYENDLFLYVLPGIRLNFIEFCINYHPNYLDLIKKSFLLCNLIEFIFEQYLSNFDVVKSKDDLIYFKYYKKEFQTGLFDILLELEGGYTLSEPQKKYLIDKISSDERRLLHFLKPENLKKLDLSIEGLTDELLSLGITLTQNAFLASLPIGAVIKILKEIKELNEFKKEKLDFILSLTILKKLTNVGEIIKATNCAVCNITPYEIELMSDDECMKFIYESELCIQHMVGRLDIRKRFHLGGKNLLKTMKKLGDNSIFITE